MCRENLEMQTDSLEKFKALMELVTTVNDSAIDAEIRLMEMREMYSTLQSYEYPLVEAEKEDLVALPKAWKELRNLAHRKTRQLASIKEKFAGEKKLEVGSRNACVSTFALQLGRNASINDSKSCVPMSVHSGCCFHC